MRPLAQPNVETRIASDTSVTPIGPSSHAGHVGRDAVLGHVRHAVDREHVEVRRAGRRVRERRHDRAGDERARQVALRLADLARR